MAEVNGTYQINTPVILSYPHVIEPVAFKGPNGKSKDPKYSASFVMDTDHPDLAPIKALIAQVARAEWPTRDIGADVKAGEFKLPFLTGDKIADKRVAKRKAAGKEADTVDDWQRGKIVFRASSDFQPGLGVLLNKQIVEVTPATLAIHKNAFYPGVKVLATLNFKAWKFEDGGSGVTAYLTNVLSLNTGTKLAGHKSVTEAFKGVAGLASAEDPTAGMAAGDLDDEIPF